MALQIRRGTDAERQSITPAEGELIYTTDTNQLYVGGKIAPSTTLSQGGILVSGALVNDTNPTLSTNLNLNGHDITGTGNININGTITATGNINLGDGVEDNVIVGGQIGSSLIPGADRAYDLGATGGAWRDLYAVAVNVETTASVGDLEISGNIISPDSSVVYNGLTGDLTVGNVNATGDLDLGGSIISNSSKIYDAATGDLSVGNIVGDGNMQVLGNINLTGNIVSDAGSITIPGDVRSATVTTNSISAWDGILEITGSLEATGNCDIAGVLSSTGFITGSISATTVQGDLTGSVFAQDSTVLVDGLDGVITGPVNNTSVNTEGLTTSTQFVDVTIGASVGGLQFLTTGNINDDYSLFEVLNFQNTVESSNLTFVRSRGTADVPASAQAGDQIQTLLFAGTSADASPAISATISASVDNNGTVGNGIVPGKIELVTSDDAGQLVVGLGLNRNGEITVADNTLTAGVGSGQVDDSAAVSYLQITVGGTTYAMPLFAINP